MQDTEQYLRELRRQNFMIVRSPHTGHLKIYDPRGCLTAVCSGTSSDWRALRNLRADIRRHQCPEREQDVSERVRQPSRR